MNFNGLNCSIGTMHLLSDAQTRSISFETKSGVKSGGGLLVSNPAYCEIPGTPFCRLSGNCTGSRIKRLLR